MCVIVLVILRCLGLRKANVRYCSSDFKVFGLEKSKCCVIVLVILRYLGLRKANVRLFCVIMYHFCDFLLTI